MRCNFSDIKFAIDNLSDYLYPKDVLDAWWFTKVKNVGDLLTPYLLNKITGKRIRKNIFGVTPHVLCVGSILDQATEHSVIWGSGAISTRRISSHIKDTNVYMLRGVLTKKELGIYSKQKLVLADPGMVLSEIYSPKVKKKYKIGIIPHYVDLKHFPALVRTNDDVCLIDVRSEVEEFVNKLLSCEYVFSSSLHGLIIADSFEIPNCWVRFKNGYFSPFKYFDYFSVFPEKQPQVCRFIQSFSDLNINQCSVRRNQKLINLVLRSFPGELF